MRKKTVLRFSLILAMAVLTSIWVFLQPSFFPSSRNLEASAENPKRPVEYDVWKAYVAEGLETQLDEWYTPENLGITLTKANYSNQYDTYEVWIVNETKALAWMRYEEFTPNAIQYESRFYRITYLEIFPGYRNEPSWQAMIWGATGAGWILAGIVFMRGRRKKELTCV